MQVQLLRKNGRGIKGTYANAHHHAPLCVPLIQALEKGIKKCGFVLTKQGHNVHLFETSDGRKFDIIPYYDGKEYVGMEIRIRKSRSSAERLTTITSLDEIDDVLAMLKMLAKPLPVNHRGAFGHELQ